MSTTSTTATPTSTSPAAADPLLPGAEPTLFTDGGVTYANVTIDDFSPLITYSGWQLGGDWVSPLTDSVMSAVRPAPQRDWYLGTYRRTENGNATLKIDFWGSEIHLYGDRGPLYGSYSLQLDQETPLLRTAYSPTAAAGPAAYLDSLKNLTDGEHELLITNLGARESGEGEGFLLDFALVKQQVGPLNGHLQPGISDIKGSDLSNVNATGAWLLNSVDEDVVTANGQNANQPKTFYSSQANGASLVHSFSNATAIQVYGTRNATHGLYSAILSTLTGTQPLSSQTFNGSAPCGFSGPSAENVLPSCEWQGSVLKYAAGNLDPAASYQLVLENIDPSGRVFDVDLIRTIAVSVQSSGAPSSRGLILGHVVVVAYILWRSIFK